MITHPQEVVPPGIIALLNKVLDTPFSSIALVGVIGVIGISLGWIEYQPGSSEGSLVHRVDTALPTMASKEFKSNKYDNAAMVNNDQDPLADMGNQSLQEKLNKQPSKGSDSQWQTRDQVRHYYEERLDDQATQNRSTIEAMTRPAPLSPEEIAERRARDQALARASQLENSAYDQLNQLEQPAAYENGSAWPDTSSAGEVAQVTVAGLEDYVDYQPAAHRPMNAFYGLRGERIEPELVDAQPVPNAIEAVIHGEADAVTVTDGSTLKLRLLQDIQVDRFLVPRNSLLSGECVIRGERVQVLLTSIRVENSIMPIRMRVYDIDGHAGIYVPNMALKNQVAQTGSQAVTGGSLNMPYMVPSGGNVGEMVVGQTAAQGINMAMTGARSVAAKKISQQRATIRPNYHVYLKQE